MGKTATSAIRVWAGLKLPDVKLDDFYAMLGNTFIPGTLYMLRPLGIYAYNIAVITQEESDIPSECALIVYGSRDGYRGITRENLRGRVHRASHNALFDMMASRASFPEFWRDGKTNTDTTYLFEQDMDWQKGFIWFIMITVPSGNTTKLFNTFINVLKDLLVKANCGQCILLQRGRYATLWLCFENDLTEDQVTDLKAQFNALFVGEPIVTVAKFFKLQTYPSFTDFPELLSISGDLGIQYKFIIDPSTTIYL